MRGFFTARIRSLRVNWIWPLALLALPGCALSAGGIAPPLTSNLDPGPEPSGVVFCQIEKPESRHCPADEQEIADLVDAGFRLAAGAEALIVKATGTKVLDYSKICDNGLPQVVEFEGPFPEGLPVCVDCSARVPDGASALDVCIAQCEDLTAPGVVPATAITFADCANRTSVAVNALEPTFCSGACSDAGAAFVYERRIPDPVVWKNQVGVDDGGGSSTLTRSADNPTHMFDAGADSGDTVDTVNDTGNDAYVEFTASGPAATRVAGFSEGPGDTNTDYHQINFAISLFSEGCYYVFEKGAQVIGPYNNCSASGDFGTFGSTDKFRISLKDKFDGTAEVSYAKVTGSCSTNIECMPFYTSLTPAHYPLRVDTSFLEQGGQLGAVVLVRIR